MNGKKTYAVAALSIFGALAAAISGQLSYPEAAQLIVTAVMGATIRHGVATSTEPKP